jgi:hypothetical protein
MDGQGSQLVVLPILSSFYLFSAFLSGSHSGVPWRQGIFSCNPNIVSINFLQAHISPSLWCPIHDKTGEMYVP